MALIKCTECGKDFSDKAAACPNCGCPTEEVLKGISNSNEISSAEPELPKYRLLVVLGSTDVDIAAIIREKVTNHEKNLKFDVIESYYKSAGIKPNDAMKELWAVNANPKIKCKKCSKTIFAEDEYCIFCGQVQQNDEIYVPHVKEVAPVVNPNIENSDQPHCPKCGSTQIAAKSKGFGVGKAAAGAILLGPIGLLGGAIGSNKTVIVCLTCGNEWKAGQ